MRYGNECLPAANLKLERDDDRFGGKYYILAHQKNTALMSSGFCQRLDPFRFSTTGYFPLTTGMVELLKSGDSLEAIYNCWIQVLVSKPNFIIQPYI